jgi:predicted RNase H-like HicB family nuclease
MEYTMYVEKTSDGWYFGECVQIPEAFSQGKTISELKANVLEVIKLFSEELPEKYQFQKTQPTIRTIFNSNETKQIIKTSNKEPMFA